MITIKDMANKADVSPTTISNVLHGRTEKLSKDTLERVRKVIEESNYVSNMGARLLANNGSRILGVILTYDRRNEKNAIQDPFYGELVGALEQEIRQKGYYMMLYTSRDIDENLRLAKAWNIEGMIVLGASPVDCHKFKSNTNVPIVFIDSYVNDDEYVYANVGLQDKEGGYLATRFLIENGHKKIAFLADMATPVGVDKERLDGYKQAMAESNLSDNCSFFHVDYRNNERHEYLKEFMQKNLKNYTALFFASDFYAVDAIGYFQARSIKIPDDISIVGFDDNVLSQICYPLLTTVHQSVTDKVKHAVNLLFKIINKEEIEEYKVRLPIHLVIRNSVKKLN